jgi:hypothetical protein
MSILLRYFDRTKDDYKSFVSFLNLRNNEKVLEGEKLNLILTGISEMTSDVQQQRHLVSHLIEKDFQGIITSNYSDSEIINKSKEFAKTELEKQVSNLSEKVEKLENETTKKEQIIGSTIKTAKSKKVHNKELTNELTQAEKSNQLLFSENINLKIEKGISKWKRILWLYIPIAIILITIYILALFFDTSSFNIGKKILNHIDAQTSESKKNLLNSLFYSPFAAIVWLVLQSINKFNTAKITAKKKELKEEYENTTMYKNNKG